MKKINFLVFILLFLNNLFGMSPQIYPQNMHPEEEYKRIFENLLDEIWFNVLNRLSRKDLASASAVSKKIHEISRDQDLYENQKIFPLFLKDGSYNPKSYLDVFMNFSQYTFEELEKKKFTKFEKWVLGKRDKKDNYTRKNKALRYFLNHYDEELSYLLQEVLKKLEYPKSNDKEKVIFLIGFNSLFMSQHKKDVHLKRVPYFKYYDEIESKILFAQAYQYIKAELDYLNIQIDDVYKWQDNRTNELIAFWLKKRGDSLGYFIDNKLIKNLLLLIHLYRFHWIFLHKGQEFSSLYEKVKEQLEDKDIKPIKISPKKLKKNLILRALGEHLDIATPYKS